MSTLPVERANVVGCRRILAARLDVLSALRTAMTASRAEASDICSTDDRSFEPFALWRRARRDDELLARERTSASRRLGPRVAPRSQTERLLAGVLVRGDARRSWRSSASSMSRSSSSAYGMPAASNSFA